MWEVTMTTIAQMFGSAFDVPDAETAAHGAGNYRYQEGPSCSHDPHPYRNPTPQAFPETDAARDAAKLAAFQLAEEWALTTPAELTQALVSALTAFSGNIEIFCIYISVASKWLDLATFGVEQHLAVWLCKFISDCSTGHLYKTAAAQLAGLAVSLVANLMRFTTDPLQTAHFCLHKIVLPLVTAAAKAAVPHDGICTVADMVFATFCQRIKELPAALRLDVAKLLCIAMDCILDLMVPENQGELVLKLAMRCIAALGRRLKAKHVLRLVQLCFKLYNAHKGQDSGRSPALREKCMRTVLFLLRHCEVQRLQGLWSTDLLQAAKKALERICNRDELPRVRETAASCLDLLATMESAPRVPPRARSGRSRGTRGQGRLDVPRVLKQAAGSVPAPLRHGFKAVADRVPWLLATGRVEGGFSFDFGRRR